MTVILKDMFTRAELLADPSLLPEVEEDVMTDCAKIGEAPCLRESSRGSCDGEV